MLFIGTYLTLLISGLYLCIENGQAPYDPGKGVLTPTSLFGYGLMMAVAGTMLGIGHLATRRA